MEDLESTITWGDTVIKDTTFFALDAHENTAVFGSFNLESNNHLYLSLTIDGQPDYIKLSHEFFFPITQVTIRKFGDQTFLIVVSNDISVFLL